MLFFRSCVYNSLSLIWLSRVYKFRKDAASSHYPGCSVNQSFTYPCEFFRYRILVFEGKIHKINGVVPFVHFSPFYRLSLVEQIFSYFYGPVRFIHYLLLVPAFFLSLFSNRFFSVKMN